MTLEELLKVVIIAERKAQEDYTKVLMMHKPNWETSGEKYCFYIFMYLRKALSTVIENTNQA